MYLATLSDWECNQILISCDESLTREIEAEIEEKKSPTYLFMESQPPRNHIRNKLAIEYGILDTMFVSSYNMHAHCWWQSCGPCTSPYSVQLFPVYTAKVTATVDVSSCIMLLMNPLHNQNNQPRNTGNIRTPHLNLQPFTCTCVCCLYVVGKSKRWRKGKSQ